MNFIQWLGVAATGKTLAVGDPAPDIAAVDEQGNKVRLADLCGDGFALVYFYPKADTPGCTAQACSLRDSFVELQERGVRVIGVSADRPAAQLRFKEKFHLPFTLLADQDHAVAGVFGVSLLLGMPRRQSFLFKDRSVVWRDLSASTRDQAKDVLKVIDARPA